MVEWNGEERRTNCGVCPYNSEEHLNGIAERAAEKAFEKMYQAVGKGVLNRFAWILGIAAVSLIWWLGRKGIELPK